MNILEIEDLEKSFGENKVINKLTLAIPEHSIFGFLGRNGAGKTTTMKMILGLIKADGGEIRILGEKVYYGESKTNRYVGYLPDVPEFYGFMKSKEYLKLCGEVTGLNSKEIEIKSEELLELVGLKNINKKTSVFSRGMKQRLGIAQALINEPRLLICDEPTSALDPIGRKEILDILSRIKGKTTVIFSTHILSDVEKICDRVAVLNKGTLALSGTLEEIKNTQKQDRILIEFTSVQDLNKFVEISQVQSFIKNVIKDEEKLIIHTSDIENVQKDIFEALYKSKLTVRKLEIVEPSLESLFMEVIK